MKDEETITTEENVVNVTFMETDADGNEVEGGIKKDNSLLVKYFTEQFRPNLMGKKAEDSLFLQLGSAFDEKEREWIIGDLGINKDQLSADKYFKNTDHQKWVCWRKKELNEEFFNQLYPGQEIKTEADFRNKIKRRNTSLLGWPGKKPDPRPGLS